MKINRAGLELIKRFEGLRLEAYQDSVGVWTIGHGHTLGVKPGDKCTEDEAEGFLLDDLAASERAVSDAVTVPLNTNQFSACVCLAFNIGGAAFGRSSLVKLLNDGQPDLAADEFTKWNHAGGQILTGLTRRRQAEEELFRTPALPPPTISQSRTIQGAAAGGAATTVIAASQVIQQVSPAVDTLKEFANIAPWVMIAVLVAALIYVVYARIDDHRNSLR